MTTVSDVIAFLEKFAPPFLAEDWDNVGLLVGRHDLPLNRVMTCLTLTPDVAKEAVDRHVNMVVSHHPVLFRGVKQMTDASQEGRMLLTLIENRIAIYCPHTCFDSAAPGINQQLAETLGLTQIQPIRPIPEMENIGGGRMGNLPAPTTLRMFMATARQCVAAPYLEYVGALTANVSLVAVACGAAAEFLADAMRLGCDTFVTGEARFHTALEARAAGINLVLLGHYSSERPAMQRLADTLATEFPGLETFASLVEQDPLSMFTG
ncbi:MAG: Nif3-like dinuclear metal center hexameric protein [Planctomycetaceae bacterium]